MVYNQSGRPASVRLALRWHTQNTAGMDVLSLAEPFIGSRYRKRSTGRAWYCERISAGGNIVLTAKCYGPHCEMRDYVSAALWLRACA